MTTEEAGQVIPLFDPAELEALAARPGVAGRVEKMLRRALDAAARRGVIGPEDLGLIGSALAGARALDTAEMGGAKGGPYATAALLTPYRETLHALRLPVALQPADGAQPAAEGQGDVVDWLSDDYGTPS